MKDNECRPCNERAKYGHSVVWTALELHLANGRMDAIFAFVWNQKSIHLVCLRITGNTKRWRRKKHLLTIRFSVSRIRWLNFTHSCRSGSDRGHIVECKCSTYFNLLSATSLNGKRTQTSTYVCPCYVSTSAWSANIAELTVEQNWHLARAARSTIADAWKTNVKHEENSSWN